MYLAHLMSFRGVLRSRDMVACIRVSPVALHIEMLPTLEAETFINGLVRKSFRQLDRTKLVAAAKRQKIVWLFNLPKRLASRRSLGASDAGHKEDLCGTRLTDDVLRTIFCEVEHLVNSRPLTKCRDDSNDNRPLTPDHLLLLHGNNAYSWGVTHDSDIYWRRWRQVQHIVSLFWKRWIQEYLPELQRR